MCPMAWRRLRQSQARAYNEVVTVGCPIERFWINEWCVDLITVLAACSALDHLVSEELAKLDRERRLCLAIDYATRCVVGAIVSRRT